MRSRANASHPLLAGASPFRSPSSLLASLVALAMLAFALTFATDARAAGSFKMRSSEVNEVSGAWHVYVTLELPKAPPIAHQSMKFLFTKTVAYERSLVDGHDGPVNSRQMLSNQSPTMESLDVDFADSSGKIFKGTRFDFGLTRERGYEAGEYKVEVRTADNVSIGSPQTLILKGDNDVVDRRSMNFTAEKKGIKKVAAVDAGAPAAKNDEPAPAAAGGNGEVEPTGTAEGFIPKEGYDKTPEEEIKTRPKGCGCSVPGDREDTFASKLLWLAPLAGLGLVVARRRRAA